jgi:hypothetical protein
MKTTKKQWIAPELDEYTIDQTKGGVSPTISERLTWQLT